MAVGLRCNSSNSPWCAILFWERDVIISALKEVACFLLEFNEIYSFVSKALAVLSFFTCSSVTPIFLTVDNCLTLSTGTALDLSI